MSALVLEADLHEKLQQEGFVFETINLIDNCEGIDRKIIAKVMPRKLDDCRKLLNIAKTFRISLYPVSRGKNWGFGSAVPTSDNCLLIDLSFLNEISDYDTDFGTLHIQPGVTQIQLYNFLKKKGSLFRFDVTGSGKETSILGNSLERGVGYNFLRHENLISLKILLADGTLLETGYSRFSQSDLGKCLSHGLGPSVNNLFTQSNFGLVLGATIKLQKSSEYHCVFSYSLESEAALLENSELLKEFFDQQIINCIPKIADKRRCEIVFCSKYFERAQARSQPITRDDCLNEFNKLWGNRLWTLIASLSGPRLVVEAKLDYIKSKLENIKIRIVDAETLKIKKTLSAQEELQKDFDEVVFGYTSGCPSDDALRSTYWDSADYVKNPQDPEQQEYGFLYFAPLIPNSEKNLNAYFVLYHKLCNSFGYQPAMTFNYLNRNTIEAVISISFCKKNSFEIKKAKLFRNQLLDQLAWQGHLPYRLSADSMERVSHDADDSWSQFQKKLKQALDPEGLFSPRRYAL